MRTAGADGATPVSVSVSVSVSKSVSARAWLWCPAYPLADASAHLACLNAAERLCTALGLALTASPLLAEHAGLGAWLPAPLRHNDLLAGIATVGAEGWLLAGRGGYGCLDLLAVLPAGPLPRLIGYSDLTVLHAAWQVRGEAGGLYGLMPGVRHGTRALETTIALARGAAVTFANLPATVALSPGTADGPLFAGCLRVLAGLAGTPWMPRLRGHIVALEDLDERPYRMDRDLFQLHASGALEGISGLVFGAFPATLDARYGGPAAIDIARAWATRLQVPAIFGLPFGHDADPLSLAQGRRTEFEVGADDWRMTQTSAAKP